jgi:general secretion pathway protein M
VKLPTGSAGRLLAMGLLVAMALVFAQFVVAPVWTMHASLGHRLDATRGQLERFQRLASQLSAIRAQVATARDQDLLAPFLVNAANDALAAVELQDRLKSIALGHEGHILSTRVLQATADGPFERVIVDARLEIPLEGLQDLLHEIESRKPYLFVDELSVTARPQRRGTSGGVAQALETRLTLYGLRARAEPSEAPRG